MAVDICTARDKATKFCKLLFQQIVLKSIFRSTEEVILPNQVEDLIGCLYMYYV